MSLARRFKIELLTSLMFLAEFFTNLLRFIGLGRRYFDPKASIRLDGRTVVITGANSGIGKQTAIELAKRGAKVLMCCRDMNAGNAAASDIRKKIPKADLEVWCLDLADLSSIRNFAGELKKKHQRIDVLVNNAGVMMCPERMHTRDGFELQFGTNHLGHFLLTHLLLPLMAESDDARIVTVSSIHHLRGRIFFHDINFERNYDPVEAYCQSKMANVLFSRRLSQVLKSNSKYRHVRTYCLNPGTINTNLSRHVKGFRKIIFNIIGAIFNLDINTGTQTTLYCVMEPSIRNHSGRYYSNCCEDQCLFCESTDDRAAERLWQISCKMVGIDQYCNPKA